MNPHSSISNKFPTHIGHKLAKILSDNEVNKVIDDYTFKPNTTIGDLSLTNAMVLSNLGAKHGKFVYSMFNNLSEQIINIIRVGKFWQPTLETIEWTIPTRYGINKIVYSVVQV